MKQFIIGFIAALVSIAAGGLGYVTLGLAPVATASGPLPFEKLITGIALNARVNKEAPKSSLDYSATPSWLQLRVLPILHVNCVLLRFGEYVLPGVKERVEAETAEAHSPETSHR